MICVVIGRTHRDYTRLTRRLQLFCVIMHKAYNVVATEGGPRLATRTPLAKYFNMGQDVWGKK